MEKQLSNLRLPARGGYYFAYGSNMNTAQMAARCPGAEARGNARLTGWRVIPRLYADLVPRLGEQAHGVLYWLTRADFASLDCYEGAPEIYTRFLVPVETATGLVYAYTYAMTPAAAHRRRGLPYPEDYRLRCAIGAAQHHLPSAFGRPPEWSRRWQPIPRCANGF